MQSGALGSQLLPNHIQAGRLPSHGGGDTLHVAGHLDEVPTEILVDGVPTTVRLSPTNTHFVGAVPSDVPTGGISRAMAADNLSFEAMVLRQTGVDITERARRLAELAAPAD